MKYKFWATYNLCSEVHGGKITQMRPWTVCDTSLLNKNHLHFETQLQAKVSQSNVFLNIFSN